MPNIKPRIARRITQFSLTEIKKLAKNSRTICRHPGLTIKATSKPINKEPSDIARVLIVTPKKMGSAPQRNKIKRRIKSIFYENKLYTLQYNFIIICHKPINALTYSCLKNILLSAIKKIN